ncbi:MAG: hypothetical protein WAO00_09505 [Chthoniobacterales bacterium]
MALDLFTPVVPEERFHQSFRRVLSRPTPYDKAILAQWADGFIDRDGKFVREFQTSFDSSFWELYLHAAFKELGMACDFQWARPDFCIRLPKPFSVEASVALNAQGTLAVTETNPLEMPADFKEFNRQAIIRLSNTVHSKYKRYVESYSQLNHVCGKPFVLAITAFDRPHFYLQAQRAVEALLYRYYVDEDTYLKEHPDRDVPLLAEDLPFVLKDSGEPLPLGIFCDESMAGISAIVQSTAATWSKVRALGGDPDVMITAIYENRAEGGEYLFKGPKTRYSESILDGLRIYHNPHAEHPLDPSLFRRSEIFQATSKGPVSVIGLNENKRNLVNRSAMTFRPGFMKKVLEGMDPDTKFWWHMPPSP